MASSAARRLESESAKFTEEHAKQTKQFLAELTSLSRKYGIGIAGEAVLFVLQTGPESDYESNYKIDAESRLSFE